MAHYDIFISYSRFDIKAVNALVNRLRHDIPDIKIWYDIDGIDSSVVFQRKIVDAIEQSDLMIFVCSDNSFSSEYCRKEVMYANSIHKKVIPYLLPSTALKSWLLFEFGNNNIIDASKEEDVRQLVQSIKSWKRNHEKTLGETDPRESEMISPSVEGPSFVSLVTKNPNDRLTSLVSYSAVSDDSSTSENRTEPTIGTIKGHTYIDLDLPSKVKWATCNVGASVPEEYGDYFAWSDIDVKSAYEASNYTTYKKDADWLRGEGIIGERKQLEMSHDAARAHWGGTWRMPLRQEIEELIKNTDWQWTSVNGVKGYQVKSRVNDNSIFIPAGGYHEGKEVLGVDENGALWSASTIEGSVDLAYTLSFSARKYFLGLYNRFLGLTIRPVTD